ncbi:MAG: hypothetical protein ACJASL_004685 [Paraglaciecola sp.]|jgi:hypothetical protein
MIMTSIRQQQAWQLEQVTSDSAIFFKEIFINNSETSKKIIVPDASQYRKKQYTPDPIWKI